MSDSARLDTAVRRHPLALRPHGLTPERVASIRDEYETLAHEPSALTEMQLAAMKRIAAIIQEAAR